MAEFLENCDGFEWDEGNTNKNWYRHRVTDAESQEVFSNLPILVSRDPVHSKEETRFAVRGITNSQRRLTVIFTVREGLIRVISARDMTPREEKAYEEKTKRDTKI